ncbi:histidine acid phosphatase [Histomonas meleagridis]|uniref:histidine acid phosphatase n=1 Tax=Histomonas meleagridis TaxID=135588 RepID=UPI003559DB51|nr:histidine acid phosphatase [Histomonas meleagridis]KAH0805705.1 histidine acid phosphatase [Histomonas meleagridis]
MGLPICLAEPKLPLLVPNATLLTLFLFTRHGARVPVQHWDRPDSKNEWHCGENYYKRKHRTPVINGVPLSFKYDPLKPHPYSPSCSDGFLLDEGVSQLINLGKTLGHYLINQTKLLPEQYDSQLINVRSSFYPRCIESSVAIIDGLYPPTTNDFINVTIGTPDNEPLCPNPAFPINRQKLNEFRDTPEFKRHIDRFDRIAVPLVEYYNITFHDTFEKIFLGDFVNSLRCNKKQYPADIADPILEDLLNDMSLFVQGFASYTKPSADKPIFDLLISEIDNFFDGKSKSKFTLFSGHDVTIGALLIGLGYENMHVPPPFASQIAVEIWRSNEKDFVRFVYNGEILRYGERELTPLDVFKEEMKRKYHNGGDEL